ncbi:hypothetical protein GEV33_004437 [Tenebrio molitor]|uniref:Integrase catalytic domain-containing protein n=1 Tax=Tenebrio molitor TaxID=7067 RepID=A0A8J6HPC5_TENMO|nr:hypothetical protein GEV33_004437 [Tenebrio molitor]
MSYTSVKIEPLGKENFDTWKIQIEALLIKNDSWKYVNGTIPKPKEPPEAVTTWESNDAKARSDLILTICPSELKQIKNCPTSKDIWNKLHSVYQSQGPARKAMLLKTLILLKMKNGEDMRDHIRNFFDVVDKLEEMELCIINDLLAILLLYSIPDEYETFRIAIETQEKLPQLEALKIKLLEEYEARKRNSKENVSDAMFINKNPDSGASSHMCSEKAKFQEMKTPKVQTLNLANSCSTKIVGSGTVQLSVEENLTVRLDETLYVPDLRSNLLSVAKMTEHGFEVIFRRNEAIVTNPDTGENVMVARRDKDMYYTDELSEESRVSQISMSLQEWHERFGHLNEKDLKNIIHKQKVDGIDIKADEALPVCETCVKGKYLQMYKCLVEKKTERKIKTVRSDNGTEYTSHYLEDFLKQEGIRHELTVEYTPQQNGVAERKNRSLVETARNRCPSRSLEGEIPFKMWTGRTPIVSYFRKFGTTAFALDKTPGKGKFDSRSKKCIFIGYSVQSKAYRLWDPEARKVIRSRDVTFTGRNQAENDFTDFIDEEIFKKNPENAIEFNVPETQKEDKQTETCDLEADGETLVEEEIPVIMKREVNEEEVEPEEEENHENEELHDVAGLIEFGDPQTVSEALSSPEAADWKKAMNAEYEALKRNQTWIIVDRPQGKKTVESRWVLRTKFKKDGSVDRRKARLVAKDFTQKPGIDFNETFAPVARLGSIRLFMAIAVELGLQVHQLDFTSAYLNGEIEEEVFMEVPRNKVCLIRKALYGLKQSGRQGYKKLDEKLKQQKLKPLNSDPCVYINKEDGNIVIVVIYVDDLMVASDNPKKLQRLKLELSKSFEMKDLGPLSFCLGIEFTQNVEKQTITMSQSKYIKEILSRFNMENCKGVTTPINLNEKLSKEMCPKTEEEKKPVELLPHQSLVGSLMYLAVSTRPDIAHAVSMLSQFNTNFGEQHWRAAKRILRYLKNTENLGLMFKKSGQELVGYADADWGASIDDRRSYTGYVFNFANVAVSWESRKQRTVAMSSTEAEYMALSESTKEAIHLRRFLSEVLDQPSTTIIFNDNQGAGQLSKNNVFHNRTKHVDIRHHFIREAVERGDIKVEYLPTDQMPADVLTKGLSSPKQNKCIHALGMTTTT